LKRKNEAFDEVEERILEHVFNSSEKFRKFQ